MRDPDVAVLDVALGEERDGGLRLCGDDYLSKDSSFEFLAVRIESLLERRQALLEGDPNGDRNTQILVGPLAIDLQRAEMTWKGEPVDMSLTHYWMVLALASTPSHPQTVERLMDAAKINVAPSTVAAHMRSIRSHFRAVDAEFDAIRTERGHGYRWVS